MILKGDITIPYRWTTGPMIGRFLGEIRDNARLMGARCEGCGRVFVPPPDVCGRCFRPVADLVPLTGEGRVVAVTTVHRPMPWSPSPPPYNLALIRLDGADTNLIHLITDDCGIGSRVRPRFRVDRIGGLLDVECFVPISHPAGVPETATDENKERVVTGENSNSTPPTGDMSEMKSIAQVFEMLQSKFKPGKVSQPTVFYFSIDEDKWTVTVGPENCEVTEGKPDQDADCFLKTSREILFGTLKGDYTPSMMDFVSGKIKTNNPGLLLKFKEIFSE